MIVRVFLLLDRLTMHGESRHPASSRRTDAEAFEQARVASARTRAFGIRSLSSVRVALHRDCPDPSHCHFQGSCVPPVLKAPHWLQKNTSATGRAVYVNRASEMFACAGLPVWRHLQGCRVTDFRLGHQLTLCLPLRVLERLDVALLRFTVASFVGGVHTV